ncbi:MAG: hypothetical protein ACYDBH_20370, partial [Acidobacteriaceae bacterium]
YPVIVVDSFSHEHAGEGGILDMQEAEFQRMGARDSVKMASWIKPKGEHRRMVGRLLQVRAHLILCFRAEEKIEMVKGEGGRMEVRKKVTATGIDGWVPICEKNLPYELTVSFLLMAARPGIPLPIKLQEQHKELFPLDRPIDEACGKRLAQWAAGADKNPAPRSGEAATPASVPPPVSSGDAGPSKTREMILLEWCDKTHTDYAELLEKAEVHHADELTDVDYQSALDMLRRKHNKAQAGKAA